MTYKPYALQKYTNKIKRRVTRVINDYALMILFLCFHVIYDPIGCLISAIFSSLMFYNPLYALVCLHVLFMALLLSFLQLLLMVLIQEREDFLQSHHSTNSS